MFAVAVVALLLAAAVVLVALRMRATRIALPDRPLEGVTRRHGRESALEPLPVVLVHGLFGFDKIARFRYFHRIADHLEALGCRAHAVKLPAAQSVPDRARVLADAIAALPFPRVDLIAHSLGGLDARYALAKLGLAARVRSLVTIGTPHRGTPLADLASDGGPLVLARKAVAALGVRLTALDWLSTAALERFNHEILDVPGVRYACVVGGITGNPALPLVAPFAYLKATVGPNDGLVPVTSQYWGETLAEIEADHFQQIGWRIAFHHTFDALGLYAFVVARLGNLPALDPVAKPSAPKSTPSAMRSL